MKLAGDIGVGGVFRKPPSLTLALGLRDRESGNLILYRSLLVDPL